MKSQNSKSKLKNKRNITEDFEEIQSMHDIRKKESMANLSYKIDLKFKSKKQKEYYDTLKNNRISFVKGAAGTGKTMIALLLGLEMLKSGEIKKIVLTKPIIEAASGIGFLPGTIEDKVSVYMYSFYDNVEKIIGKEWFKYLIDNKLLVCMPLNYMRGNTLGGIDHLGNPVGYFCICDEIQNATVKEMKLFISRLGENTKLCILGDSDQSDLKLRNNEIDSLTDAFERFKNINQIGFFEFTEDDIVRDPMLIEIMKRYKTNQELKTTMIKS